MPMKNRDPSSRGWFYFLSAEVGKVSRSKWNKDYILEEIRAAKEAKACGWLLWSASNNYKVSWQALKSLK